MEVRMFLRGMILYAGMVASLPLHAQENQQEAAREALKYMQRAEAALAEEEVAAAEALYRQAIAKDPSNAEARYNLGNLYYKSEIPSEAVERHSQSAEVATNKSLRHRSFHNQGNALMVQKKYKAAVEAYKNALRNNPDDDETRYNLALAQKKLEEERKGGGDQNKDQKNQEDQKKNQNKKNQDQQGEQGEQEKDKDGKPQKKDKGGQQENQDKKKGKDEKEDEGDPQNQDKQEKGEGSKKEQQKRTHARPGELSPQQVKNLLEAMGNEERKVQEKVNAEKVASPKTKTEKDW